MYGKQGCYFNGRLSATLLSEIRRVCCSHRRETSCSMQLALCYRLSYAFSRNLSAIAFFAIYRSTSFAPLLYSRATCSYNVFPLCIHTLFACTLHTRSNNIEKRATRREYGLYISTANFFSIALSFERNIRKYESLGNEGKRGSSRRQRKAHSAQLRFRVLHSWLELPYCSRVCFHLMASPHHIFTRCWFVLLCERSRSNIDKQQLRIRRVARPHIQRLTSVCLSQVSLL